MISGGQGAAPGCEADNAIARLDPTVEMYRKRRFMVVVALTVLVLITCSLAGVSLTSLRPLSGSGEGEADRGQPAVHVVRPGDTYAGIASDLGVANPGRFAEVLRAANGDAALVAGERLVVDLSNLEVSR